MSRIARLAAYAAALITIGSCTMGEIWADPTVPTDVHPADLTGTWHSTSNQKITFAANGTFAATDLPREAFSNLDPADQQLDGSGTWQLEPSVVALTYERLGGIEAKRNGPNLDARREGEVTWLYFFYGTDGSSWTAYRK